MRLDDVLSALKELDVHIKVSPNEENFSVEIKNLMGMQIGILRNIDNKLYFNVYDPQHETYTPEGGECLPTKDSIKEIIDEFTYFPYDLHLNEAEGYQYLALGALLKDSSVSNLDHYTNLIYKETEKMPTIYFYEVPDEYQEEGDDTWHSYGLLDAIRKAKKDKPSANIIIMHSLS